MSNVHCIILAAGFGTRLASSIRQEQSQAFLHLLETPKPLLPLPGTTIVQRWLQLFAPVTANPVVVVSNAAHYDAYRRVLGLEGEANGANASVILLNDGAVTNETRLGAVADIEFAIRKSSRKQQDEAIYIVVAGDTLLAPSVDVKELLGAFEHSALSFATVGYEMKHPDVECRSRGVMKLSPESLASGQLSRQGDGIIGSFVEKPPTLTPEEARVSLASAPLYFFKPTATAILSVFLEECRNTASNGANPTQSRASYDAPGHFLQYLCQKRQLPCLCMRIESRIDIGTVDDYIEALQLLSSDAYRRGQAEAPVGDGEVVVGTALPRVGFLGNPSDGYGGRCVSFTIRFEGARSTEARVFVKKNTNSGIEILPSNETSAIQTMTAPLNFPGSWNEIVAVSQSQGYKNDCRLLQATLYKFYTIVSANPDTKLLVDSNSNLTLGYYSNIPYCVGLAGSSAIIVATIRALLKFYRFSPSTFGDDTQWAIWIMEVETQLLKIAAGMQDRVAQWFGRPMYMDFANFAATKGATLPTIEPLSEKVVQRLRQFHLFVVYSKKSEESGIVHTSLRSLYETEEHVRESMRKLTALPLILKEDDFSFEDLCSAVDTNFELRRSMLGESATGQFNIHMVTLARENGFSAKQAGSGGAIVCLLKKEQMLAEETLQEVKERFRTHGYELCRVFIPA